MAVSSSKRKQPKEEKRIRKSACSYRTLYYQDKDARQDPMRMLRRHNKIDKVKVLEEDDDKQGMEESTFT